MPTWQIVIIVAFGMLVGIPAVLCAIGLAWFTLFDMIREIRLSLGYTRLGRRR